MRDTNCFLMSETPLRVSNRRPISMGRLRFYTEFIRLYTDAILINMFYLVNYGKISP